MEHIEALRALRYVCELVGNKNATDALDAALEALRPANDAALMRADHHQALLQALDEAMVKAKWTAGDGWSVTLPVVTTRRTNEAPPHRSVPAGTGIGTHALATEISQAVAQDERGAGSDIAAGYFGPAMTELMRKIASEYLQQPQISDDAVDRAARAMHKAYQQRYGEDDFPWSTYGHMFHNLARIALEAANGGS